MNGTVCDTPEAMYSRWAKNLGNLAEPEHFDLLYLGVVHKDIFLKKKSKLTTNPQKVNHHNITSYILSKLKNIKAADI